jgi:hypothetical protein
MAMLLQAGNVPSLYTTFSNEVLEMQLNSDGQSRGSSKNKEMLTSQYPANKAPKNEICCKAVSLFDY